MWFGDEDVLGFKYNRGCYSGSIYGMHLRHWRKRSFLLGRTGRALQRSWWGRFWWWAEIHQMGEGKVAVTSRVVGIVKTTEAQISTTFRALGKDVWNVGCQGRQKWLERRLEVSMQVLRDPEGKAMGLTWPCRQRRLLENIKQSKTTWGFFFSFYFLLEHVHST